MKNAQKFAEYIPSGYGQIIRHYIESQKRKKVLQTIYEVKTWEEAREFVAIIQKHFDLASESKKNLESENIQITFYEEIAK